MTSFLLPLEMPRRSAALRDAKSQSAETRWVTAMALGQVEDPDGEAKAALFELLNDDIPEVRAQAIEGLSARHLLGEAVPPDFVAIALLDTHPSVRCAAVDAAAMLLDSPEEAVSLRLQDDDPSVRAAAVCALSDLGSTHKTDAAATLLSDADPFVIFRAAVALCILGDERGVPVLLARLGEGTPDALEAALALGKLGHPAAKEALRKVATRRFAPVELRAMAAAALVRSGDESGLSILERFVRSRRQSTRMTTLSVIARLPISGINPLLRTIRSGNRPLEAAFASEILDGTHTG